MQVRKIATLGAVVAIATTGAVALPGVAADAATKGRIAFLLAEQDVNGKDTYAAVVHGAINGSGRDVSKDNTNYDTVHLAGGSIRITHPDKDAKFSYKPNAKTCYFAIAGKGTYTLGHGTGKYKGATGSGSYKITGGGFAPKKKGVCDFNSDTGGSFVGSVSGGGPVSLP